MPAPERPKAGKGRCTIVYPDTTRAQRAERKALAKFTQTYQDTLTTQKTMAEGSGHRPPWPVFLHIERQDLCISPTRDDPGDKTMPPL